ncbi:hypothetical protein ML5_1404 [Micromonospora sp. L5]|nr:hypothetical protein ML5_1404 [Micromonospora sp. L5]
MSEKTNGSPSPKGKPSQKKNQTAVKSTGSFDLSRCDAGCGACWITLVGDRRYCEVEATSAARRDLAEMLARGGDDA